MEIKKDKQISVVRACKIIKLERSMYYYSSVKDDSEVEEKLRWYAEKYSTRGFPEYYKRIRKEGLKWNHKRVRRVYRNLGMSKRKRVKRRLQNPEKQPLLQPLEPNMTWSMDFMQDSLESGRRFRTLNITDDYNREALAVDPEYSFASEKVVSTLKRVIEWRGKPEAIRSDNGPEFTAKSFKEFCEMFGITHKLIQKGKPMQNGYIERFNRTYREDVLDSMIFSNLNQVREETSKWMEDYNEKHPHSSLSDMSPREFLNSKAKKKMSTLAL